MKELPRISDSELLIMKILWRKSDLTASEIIAELSLESDWSPKTIHTLISRLVKKEAIGVDKAGAFYHYSPILTEEECRGAETKSFIHKFYDGSLNLLVTNFLKQESLSKSEIEELQKILNGKKE
jgi:BlaI family transcriptional regulator, penicillinase repressor